MKREKSWLLKEADRLRSQIMLTSLGAGSSSITCACEFISGLWGGALSRLLCACSHVEGTCLGTRSELNPRTIETSKAERRIVPCMGDYLIVIFNLLSFSLRLRTPIVAPPRENTGASRWRIGTSWRNTQRTTLPSRGVQRSSRSDRED